VRHLKKRYGSRTVVKDVSLDVKSGEVVGLLGPNGAGKTTSFYMIVGLVALDEGDIVLDGQHISGLAIHERARMGLSYLPQEASVFRKLNVEENIRAVLELQVENGKPLPKPKSIAGWTRCSTTCRSPTCATTRRCRCRAASAAAWKSRARWRRAALHPARRTVRRRGPDRRGRNPAHRQLPEGTQHRRADHRPQRARNAGHLRPRVHHQRRHRAGRRQPRKSSPTSPCDASTWAKTSACDAARRALPAFRQLAVGDHEVEAIGDSNFRSNNGKMRIE
jgi:ABC-type branched-subunit amino acid transport system ATPase component